MFQMLHITTYFPAKHTSSLKAFLFNFVKITNTERHQSSQSCNFFSFLRNHQQSQKLHKQIQENKRVIGHPTAFLVSYFFRTWLSILIVGLISAPLHMRMTHNSAGFLLLHELTEKGSVASTHCIPVMTFILNTVQWNVLFKHAGLSRPVPFVT